MFKIVLTIFLSFFLLNLSLASDFDDFKKEFSSEKFYDSANEDFNKYQKEINQEFELYKKIVDEEFKKYKSEISKKWDNPILSDNKKWVEYSKNLNKRKIVDFKNKNIQIDLKVDFDTPNDELIDLAANELEKLITETKKQAWENDVLSRNIENAVKSKTKYYKTAEPSNQYVIGDLYFKKKPRREILKQKIIDLLSNGDLQLIQKNNSKAILQVKVKLPKNTNLRKAYKLKPYVAKYAENLKLSKALIFSIIHNESSFNPFARSYVPAYGLMQIVPRTAGKDATKYLFGKPKLLLPSYLYKSENNIKIGTAYVHILYYRYLRKIKNPESRIYCTIAAYNTGSSNVAKAFVKTGRMSDAAPIINSKTPQEVYNILINNLPYKETRNYLKKVSKTMSEYNSI